MDVPLIVFGAGRPWHGVAGTHRMLATALARYAEILWVDPPVSPVTRSDVRYGTGRLPLPRLRPVAERITALYPTVLPFHSRRGIRQTSPVLVRSQISWALRRLGRRPYAVLDGRLGRLLGGWGDGVRNVLYGTDDFVAGATLMGVAADHLRADERYSLATADLVLAVSTPLQERWGEQGAEVLLVPNGVRTESYADLDSVAPAPDVRLPHPIAGVIGQLSARIDLALLEAVVAEGCSLLLVGPGDPRWEPERFARLCAQPRVQWVGFQPYESLPGYLRAIDVGLTPYVDSEFNRASFPLKTLEYLAAGLPTVSTDLPATRWLDTDLVHITNDAAEFAKAARELAEDGGAALASARRAFAERHSWDARAETVAQAMGLIGTDAEAQ
jgi:teichuronic acid biosynthesis glycosyltransferase TuaH